MALLIVVFFEFELLSDLVNSDGDDYTIDAPSFWPISFSVFRTCGEIHIFALNGRLSVAQILIMVRFLRNGEWNAEHN